MRSPVLSFGDCELRVAGRELRVKGRPRELEPKVFDVLAYLAAHHSRVVARRELLDAIWAPGTVSDSVLATSIMKARRAIDDNDPDLPIIRTLHRVGYRLAADVEISTSETQPSDGAVPQNSSRERIATLPFQNFTGRQELIWIEYGLAALLSQSLSQRAQFTVVPTLEVVALTEGAGKQMTPRSCARLVSTTLDAKYVVSVQVREISAELELGYCVFHGNRILRVGALRGADLIDLTLQLAGKVCDDVLLAGS